MQQEVGRHGPWGRESCPVGAFTLLPITLDGQLSVLLSLQAPGMSQKWQHPSDPLDPFGQGKCLEDLLIAASLGLAGACRVTAASLMWQTQELSLRWWLWWLGSQVTARVSHVSSQAVSWPVPPLGASRDK